MLTKDTFPPPYLAFLSPATPTGAFVLFRILSKRETHYILKM